MIRYPHPMNLTTAELSSAASQPMPRGGSIFIDHARAEQERRALREYMYPEFGQIYWGYPQHTERK